MNAAKDTPFFSSLQHLLSPTIKLLKRPLSRVAGLQEEECELIFNAAHESLLLTLHGRLARVLLVELHAARENGMLMGETSEQRWAHFIDLSSKPCFWESLQQHYPSLLARTYRIVHNRCAAALEFAGRWATDRANLGTLCGGDAGLLLALSFDAGDSHKQGRTVVIVKCEGGKLVYKPRPMDIDTALANFLRRLADVHPEPITAKVPCALARGEYGWTAFVEHRHAASNDELQGFYRGIGQWLGVLRLLGGTDMHAQNVIAHGAHPVIVDCETLFTPKLPGAPSGYGLAVDQAGEWVSGTVLGTGMLPGRGTALGWRGIDISSVGALPEQQPSTRQPVILQAGTDEARLGMVMMPVSVSQNHPSPQPALADYWPHVLDAFDGINVTLRKLDGSGVLRSELDSFAGCRIRVVTRPTETYAELARMLWHPASLHNEAGATEHVRDLLSRMADNTSIAPGDITVIHAEIADLKEGDIPFFSTTAAQGQLEGPRGTRWLLPANLIDVTLDHWRNADLRTERGIIHAALVSAYINDGGTPEHKPLWPPAPRLCDLDVRRRALLSTIMRDVLRHAIYGEDGSVTWVAPSFDPGTGWSVRPLAQDLYSGLSGVALLVAAYRHEARAGRADPIEELDALQSAVLHTLRMAEARHELLRADRIKIRPFPPGGYAGLGSLIWTWLTLDTLTELQEEGLARARALASLIPEAAAASDSADVLYGLAGAIPPLLSLAEHSGDGFVLDTLKALGDQLHASAVWDGNRAYWPHDSWPHGLGGFSHGVTGIGWALTKLARATGEQRYRELADAAFAFEEGLFDTHAQNWLDLRTAARSKTVTAWCHGAIGIGLAHLDLDPSVQQASTRMQVSRAAIATWRSGLGLDHCACHGDASAWELLDAAIAHDLGPRGLSRETLLAQWLTSLEQHGPRCGMVADAFMPGLMTGVGGIAYQLLRTHPQRDLPSVLVLGHRSTSPENT
jgi:type 2 lantibiotic biosynthesis protein LanM